MAPMTHEERAELLKQPGVTEADVDEYNQLLSMRFSQDPDAADANKDRLAELAAKLYPQTQPAEDRFEQALTKMAAECTALDAQLENLPQEERQAALNSWIGLPADANEEDFAEAVTEHLASVAMQPEFLGELSLFGRVSSAASPPQTTQFDEACFALIKLLLRKYDHLEPAERRTAILAMYDLPADASDETLESAVRREIADAQKGTSDEITEQCVSLILSKAAQ